MSTIGSTGMLIEWSIVPELLRRGILKGYIVRYTKAGSGLAAVEHTLALQEYSLELKELGKFTVYDITVAASTAKGEGTSWNNTFMTGEDGKGNYFL